MILFNIIILMVSLALVSADGLGSVGERRTVHGKLEVIGMDFFDEGKHYMFCAFIPDREEEGSLTVIDNISIRDCQNGVDLEVELQVRGRPLGEKHPTVQEQRSYVHPLHAPHVAEPMNYPHGAISRIVSIDGQHHIEADAFAQAKTPPEQLLKQQLVVVKAAAQKKKEMKQSLRGGGRRLAKASGDSSILVVRVLLAGDSGSNTVDGYCDETCAYNNAWGADSARASYLQSSYNALNIKESLGELRTISLSTTLSDYPSCDFIKLGDDAVAAVEASGLSTSSFDMITFYMSKNLNCGFGGVAYVGGVRSWEVSGFVGVLTHELGHSLSVWHAATDSNNDGQQVITQ